MVHHKSGSTKEKDVFDIHYKADGWKASENWNNLLSVFWKMV